MTLATLKDETVEVLVRSLDSTPELWRWHGEDRYFVQGPQQVLVALAMSSRPYIYKPSRVEFGFWQTRRLRKALRRWAARTGESLTEASERATCFVVLWALA